MDNGSRSPVFTSDDYHGEPGKDFDCRIRYDAVPGDAGWHDRAVAAQGFPPEQEFIAVDLSSILGTSEAIEERLFDIRKPGECWHCKCKAVRVTGRGEPVCSFHKQFFFTRPIREDDAA